MHPQFKDEPQSKNVRANAMETEIEYWKQLAQERLRSKLQTENSINTNRAKNIVMFLGDGMSLPTVAATRMYLGGEEEELSFEKFPHFGLSKVVLPCTMPFYATLQSLFILRRLTVWIVRWPTRPARRLLTYMGSKVTTERSV